MKFFNLAISGSYLIQQSVLTDERGFFARFYCKEEFSKAGLVTEFPQMSNSLSVERGTLRGFHYQLPPAGETKVLSCFRGGLHVNLLDLQPNSPTFGKTVGVSISGNSQEAIYVPEGVANAFLTLEPDTAVFYLTSKPYTPELERGIRWNDPNFDIQWPFEPFVISEKDANHANFNFADHSAG